MHAVTDDNYNPMLGLTPQVDSFARSGLADIPQNTVSYKNYIINTLLTKFGKLRAVQFLRDSGRTKENQANVLTSRFVNNPLHWPKETVAV